MAQSEQQDATKREEDMEEHFLNDCWSFYFHNPNDENWGRSSFQKITDITTIEGFWGLNQIVSQRLHQGMFFLMRESIFPLWEEKDNRDGGYLSLKILKTKVPEIWEDLCSKLLSDNILIGEHAAKWDHINGISISPKKSFCIVKLWLKSKDVTQPNMFGIQGPEFSEVLFKSHTA
jgi:hypothetical protein